MAPQKYVTRDELMFLLNQRIPGARAAPYPVDLSDPGQVSSDLPLANLQQASATKRLLARVSSGAGDWEEATLSDVLDFITGAAQGDVLYRGASAWARLAADTDGKVLTTHGAGADPTWETASGGGAWTLLEQHTASSSASLDFTTCITSTYNRYEFYFEEIVPATNNAVIHLRTSTDGGATFNATGIYSYNYQYHNTGADPWTSVRSTGNTQWAVSGGINNTTSFGGTSGCVRLDNPLGSADKRFSGDLTFIDAGGDFYRVLSSGFTTSTTAVNAVRFLASSGNIASGTIYCFGLQK